MGVKNDHAVVRECVYDVGRTCIRVKERGQGAAGGVLYGSCFVLILVGEAGVGAVARSDKKDVVAGGAALRCFGDGLDDFVTYVPVLHRVSDAVVVSVRHSVNKELEAVVVLPYDVGDLVALKSGLIRRLYGLGRGSFL